MNVSVKAIDRMNPGGASADSLRRNVELTVAAPLNVEQVPPLVSLADFSILNEVQAELGIRRN